MLARIVFKDDTAVSRRLQLPSRSRRGREWSLYEGSQWVRDHFFPTTSEMGQCAWPKKFEPTVSCGIISAMGTPLGSASDEGVNETRCEFCQPHDATPSHWK